MSVGSMLRPNRRAPVISINKHRKVGLMADRPGRDKAGSVRYVDPDELNKNPAFTNVVVVE